MRNIITTDVLKTMISAELEDYRAAGEDFRRELTHAVIGNLATPEQWDVNGEYRSEFGGFFPVQIRFTPPHGNFHIAVCSPGDVSPVWLMAFITPSGHPFSVIRSLPTFNPEIVNHTLSLVACLDADCYSAASIISLLAMEGEA